MTSLESRSHLWIILILVLLPQAGGKSQDPAVLLQQAIQKEMVDGDLKAAIEQYRKIAALPEAERGTAAKALLRLGQCHERLGQAEARQVYQRIIGTYPDQKEQALATGSIDARMMKFGWSPDGATIAFTGESGGDRELWLMEDFLHLVAGRPAQGASSQRQR